MSAAGTWNVWSEQGGKLLFVGPRDEANRYASAHGISPLCVTAAIPRYTVLCAACGDPIKGRAVDEPGIGAVHRKCRFENRHED